MKTFWISILLVINYYCLAIPIQTDPHIKVDHFGYLPEAQKVAVISQAISGFNSPDLFNPGDNYQVRKWENDEVVFSGSPVAWNGGATHLQSGDLVWWFDFSSLSTPGSYYIYDEDNQAGSYRFEIGENVYAEVLKQAVRTYFYQRSGFAKQYPHTDPRWADQAAYLHINQDKECRLITDRFNEATAKNLEGGWFDAGDYNKYVNFTYGTLHNLLSAYQENPAVWTDDYNIPESKNGVPDLLDEIKWELEWLIRMQQPDGSVLMKVGEAEGEDSGGESPPSSDFGFRYYGPANGSAARTVASVLAHAYLVYNQLEQPEMQEFAQMLLEKALLSWDWIEANPAITSYQNQGFSSANPDRSEYDQNATQITAAVYLYAATEQEKFHQYFQDHYNNLNSLNWTFWYPYENTYQDALLHYTSLPGSNPGINDHILSNFSTSLLQNNADLYPAWQDQTDAYRAYLKDDDYVWGSNIVKSNTGNIFYNAVHFEVAPEKVHELTHAAAGYIHYIHGVNPLGLVFLSNMGLYGGENAVQEIYHSWFHDQTKWDNALTSPYGPAPGFLSGGPNKHYVPASGFISPPQGQPVQKSYKDWNKVWPDKSWEITEPAIYYQAAYLKLLSKFVRDPQPNTKHTGKARNFRASLAENGKARLQWMTSDLEDCKAFVVYHSDNGQEFEPVDTLTVAAESAYIKNFEVDHSFKGLVAYYYLAQMDKTGDLDRSRIIKVDNPAGLEGNRGNQMMHIYPNPAGDWLELQMKLPENSFEQISIISISGKTLFTFKKSLKPNLKINISDLSPGVYILKMEGKIQMFYRFVKQ